MAVRDAINMAQDETHGGRRFGRLVFRPSLPSAIRTLENDELRTLLVALLREWRSRTEIADEILMRVRPGAKQ